MLKYSFLSTFLSLVLWCVEVFILSFKIIKNGTPASCRFITEENVCGRVIFIMFWLSVMYTEKNNSSKILTRSVND